jgi:hypothetical protein
MSVTTSKDLAEVCLKILSEKISDKTQQFCIEVPDLLLVLMNFGTVQSKLWPAASDISFPRPFRKFSMNSFDSEKHHVPFPRFLFGENIVSLEFQCENISLFFRERENWNVQPLAKPLHGQFYSWRHFSNSQNQRHYITYT